MIERFKVRKIIINMALASILTLLFTLLCTRSDAERYIRVVGDKNYPPYEFMDESGNYVGFNIDIMNAISIEMESQMKIMPIEWEKALKMLETGEADLLQGVSYSENRSKLFDFSDEVVSNSQSIFIKRDNATIFVSSSLDGKRVSVQKDDISKEIIERKGFENVVIEEFDTQEEAIESMISGEVDAFVGNRFTGLYYIQSKNKSDKVKIADELEKTGSYSIAVKKGNTELLKEVNKALKNIKNNGTYEKISKKWLGENVENTMKWRNLFKIISVVLTIFTVMIFISIYINRKLKKEVEMRTKEINKENILKAKILESIDSAVIGFDSEGNIKILNEVANEILIKDIAIGDSYRNIPLLRNKDINILKEKIIEKDTDYESDGVVRYLKYRTVPLIHEHSDNGFLFMATDLTKEKKSNELLSQNDKMQSIGILSSGIAHEIRNPLTSIKMFVDILPDNSEDKSFIEQFMNIVPSELLRLDKLTHALLDYSKEINPEPKNISLKTILEEVMLLIKPYIKKKRIEILENYQDATIYIDPYQLKQIILNIMMNSVDSIIEHGLIKMSSIRENNHIKIIIEDNGCGIERDRLDKIFEPFYTSKATGYGIGLSVTKNLIIENKGDIIVDSEEGRGTKTTIIFPVNGGE